MSMQQQNKHMEEDSPRTQKIIEFLVNLWQKTAEPSSETLKSRLHFVLGLPEPYKSAALTAIADQLASKLILHFIDVMATFQEKAEQEGIDAEEREEYLHYILTEAFPKLVGINRAVFVQSLDNLATLSNITVNLQILSQADSAATAQSWMYELPDIYPADLRQERLVTHIQDQQKERLASLQKIVLTSLLC